MDNEGENIYKSLTFAADENHDDFTIVMRKFDEYFFPAEEYCTRESMFSPTCPVARREGREFYQSPV